MVQLSRLLSEGMVLQRRVPVRIWGSANPGERVSILFNQQIAVTIAKPDGSFEVFLKPMEAGGPYTMTVQGEDSPTITLNDVLVGEVWVCSGQSNMEWNMESVTAAREEIATARDPQLRMFTVGKEASFTPLSEPVWGTWQSTEPVNTSGFSAVGYYFAKNLRKALQVPVGMIHASWGGTRIEAWTHRDVLLKQGMPESEFTVIRRDSPEHQVAKSLYERNLARWKAAGSPMNTFTDTGRDPRTAGWESEETSVEGWQPILVPGLWESAGVEELAALDGGVWFRREFTVPEAMATQETTLTLGAIDDFDQTFINGVKVGQTGEETPNFWQHPRNYTIPAGILKPGRNVIAVRVWDHGGGGGFAGPAEALQLTGSGGKVSLAGQWLYQVERGRPQNPGPDPDVIDPNGASVLYNGMIAPLVKHTIRGALWYQGESNAGNPQKYRQQLPDMIQNWRRDWNIGDFPFFIVQLAPYMMPPAQPCESNWAALREAQTLATTRLPNVGIAVITDVGDVQDIHPQHKEPVGERLALLARNRVYGEKSVVDQGPCYRNFTAEGNLAQVTFDTPTPLVARETDSRGQAVPAGKVIGFAVCDEKGQWHWAEARIIRKDTVEVMAPTGVKIVALRYGWADFPVVNLFNATLPAHPFRTDGT